MPIGFKTFLILAVMCVTIWGVGVGFAIKSYREAALQMDSAEAFEAAKRLQQAEKNAREKLAAGVIGNSGAIFQGSRSDYARQLDALLTGLKQNLAVLFDSDGQIAAVRSIGTTLARDGGLTPEDAQKISAVSELVRRQGALSAVVVLSDGAYQFAATASQETGWEKPRVLFVASLMDSAFTRGLTSELLNDVRIFPASDELWRKFRTLRPGEPLVESPGPGDASIVSWLPIRDFAGEPAVVLSISRPRERFLASQTKERVFLGTTAAVCLGMMFLGFFALSWTVNGRISKLAQSAKNSVYSSSGNLPRGMLRGNDEITQIARALRHVIEKLRTLEGQCMALEETQEELIVRYNSSGRISFANTSFCNFFGIHETKVKDRDIRDFLGTEILGFDLLTRLPDEKERRNEFNLRIKDKQGVEHYILWRQKSLLDEYRTVSEILAVGSDQTFREKYQLMVETARRATEAADRAKSEFLNIMSHEIRTPITHILGFAFMLNKQELSEDQRKQLQGIERSATYLEGLLNNLLDFSNVVSGRISVEPGRFLTEPLLREVLEQYRPAAGNKGVSLILDLAADFPRELFTDRSRLSQVLSNLIENGLKFTLQGFVKLSGYAPRDGMVEIAVHDTGPGIPEKDLKNLFLPFRSADGSFSRAAGGMGLGLAMCKQIVEHLGGRISVKSQIGLGSIFSVFLPVKPSADVKLAELPPAPAPAPPADFADKTAPPSVGATPEPEEPTGAGKQQKDGSRVLLVDDNRTSLVVLQYLVKSLGLKVETALGGKECLQKTEKTKYDVILMDIQMPEIDGIAATKAIREREEKAGIQPRTVIIACTAFALPGDREKLLAAGLDDYISKPVRKEMLEKVLFNYLPELKVSAEDVGAPEKPEGVAG